MTPPVLSVVHSEFSHSHTLQAAVRYTTSSSRFKVCLPHRQGWAWQCGSFSHGVPSCARRVAKKREESRPITPRFTCEGDRTTPVTVCVGVTCVLITDSWDKEAEVSHAQKLCTAPLAYRAPRSAHLVSRSADWKLRVQPTRPDVVIAYDLINSCGTYPPPCTHLVFSARVSSLVSTFVMRT